MARASNLSKLAPWIVGAVAAVVVVVVWSPWRAEIVEHFPVTGEQRAFPRDPPTRAEDERLNRRIPIEAGSFQMGSPAGVGYLDEHPAHTVRLSAFLMQQHEVTNEEYQRFDPAHSFPAGRERYPTDKINWDRAKAYAEWLGGSLPTEAQWEYAARGSEGRTYPWGEEPPTCEHAQYYDCGGTTAEVMSAKRGATPEGIYDLAGNVWEWTADWYGRYSSEAATDPRGPPTGRSRVLRGGSFGDEARSLRASNRLYFAHPEDGYGHFGFRVVWVSAGGQD